MSKKSKKPNIADMLACLVQRAGAEGVVIRAGVSLTECRVDIVVRDPNHCTRVLVCTDSLGASGALRLGVERAVEYAFLYQGA